MIDNILAYCLQNLDGGRGASTIPTSAAITVTQVGFILAVATLTFIVMNNEMIAAGAGRYS